MFESLLVIHSHRGEYDVKFVENAFGQLNGAALANKHFIVDARVADFYADELVHVLASSSVLLVEARESSKSLDKMSGYVEYLLSCDVRRGHVLVAIGGGIVQDITSFLAAILLRGLQWHFYPTTLLSQADSCIGSKSSINVGDVKNVVGTFTPPKHVFVSTSVLNTLDELDVRCGLGEMLKVHAIDSPLSFDRIAAILPRILVDAKTLETYIYQSLLIKKSFIEQDEFDQGIRNILNYGHTFGHAIESATCNKVPHGIAITIGMDMANYTAMQLGLIDGHYFQRMHPTLMGNCSGFENVEVPFSAFLSAISKDKKRSDAGLRLILPSSEGRIASVDIAHDDVFRGICVEYLERGRGL